MFGSPQGVTWAVILFLKGTVARRETLIIIRLALASVLSCYQGFVSFSCQYLGFAFGWFWNEDLAVESTRGSKELGWHMLRKEIPESSDVSLVYLLMFLCFSPLYKGFFEAVAQVHWGGEISIVLPAKLSRSLQTRQMLIKHTTLIPHQQAHWQGKSVLIHLHQEPQMAGGGTHHSDR